MEVESSATSSSSKREAKSIAPVLPTDGNTGKRRRRNTCLAVISGVVLCLVVVMVILGFTVFKPKRAVTTINSVTLNDFQLSLDIVRFKVKLNVTLDLNLSVKNPNKVGFKYTNSSAFLKYRGEVVGEVPIPAGKISADQALPLNLTLTLLADRLLSNSSVYSDVISGTLPLSTFTRISGKVYILNIFKFHVVSDTSCDININVRERTVANRTCQYKTKL